MALIKRLARRRQIRRTSEEALAANSPFFAPQHTAPEPREPAKPGSPPHHPREDPPRPVSVAAPPAEPRRIGEVTSVASIGAELTASEVFTPDAAQEAIPSAPGESPAASEETPPSAIAPPPTVQTHGPAGDPETSSAPNGLAGPEPSNPDEPWQLPQWQYTTKRSRMKQRQHRK